MATRIQKEYWIPAAIAAGASIYNTVSQSRTNKKQRKWNEQMYDKQRGHALEDWTRQTEYDSPTSQMARLRQAGLNPNLVYDSGGAITQSPTVRSTEVKQWSPHAPQIDASQIGNEVSRMYNIKKTEIEIDNYKKQGTLLVEQALLTEAQKLKVQAETPGVTQDYTQKGILFPGQMDAQQLDLDQKKANIRHTFTQTEINIAQSAQTIAESIARIINYRIQNAKTAHEVKLLEQALIDAKQNEKIKELDVKFAEKGIRPQDDFKMKVIQEAFNKFMLPDFGRPPMYPSTWRADSLRADSTWKSKKK